jgi:hypothetical protein
MAEKKTARELKKVTVNFRGDVLMQAIELRQKREREVGAIVSLTEVISDLIKAAYKEQIGTGENQ